MKNLIISILSMQIVTEMAFWDFQGSDRVIIGTALVLVFWIALESMEEAVTNVMRRRRMQKRRAERFALEVIDLTKERVV